MSLLGGRYSVLTADSLSERKAVILIILSNFLFFIPFIIALPDHYLDDFVVFGLINSHPNNLISLNPFDPYFLFLRPVSYFSFWLDYKLFPMMPLTMKFESLLFHLLLVVSVYFLLTELKKYFNLKISNTWIFLITLVYSCYPDNFRWITWISNRTELLMILFYVISLFIAIKYLNKEKPHIHLLVLQFIFFIMSILSKQQSLHLPFLFLFFVWYKKRINTSKHGLILLCVIAFEVIIVICYSFLNASMHQPESLIFLESLWKKPFSLFGNLLIVINPYYGEMLYNYFVINKWLAFLLAVMFLFAFLLLVVRLKKIKFLLLIFISFLIISFPRIFVHAGSRINSLQALYIFILLLGLIAVYKEKQFRISIIMCCILNLTTIYKYYSVEKIFTQSYSIRIHQLVSLYNDNSFIITTKDQLTLNYQYNYVIKKQYGNKQLNMAPILFSELSNIEYGKQIPRVSVVLSNNIVSIQTLSDFVFLSINPGEAPDYLFHPTKLKVEKGISGRGYSKISFEMPIEMKNKKLIYHDGVDWKVLSQL